MNNYIDLIIVAAFWAGRQTENEVLFYRDYLHQLVNENWDAPTK